MFDNDDIKKENARCRNCPYRRGVYANGGYHFFGCYHRPYTGKRVSEIKECPVGREVRNE